MDDIWLLLRQWFKLLLCKEVRQSNAMQNIQSLYIRVKTFISLPAESIQHLVFFLFCYHLCNTYKLKLTQGICKHIVHWKYIVANIKPAVQTHPFSMSAKNKRKLSSEYPVITFFFVHNFYYNDNDYYYCCCCWE